MINEIGEWFVELFRIFKICWSILIKKNNGLLINKKQNASSNAPNDCPDNKHRNKNNTAKE